MQSFYSRFLTAVERFPSYTAVELQLAEPSSTVISFTYSKLRRMAESVGNWIRCNGIAAGARCSILGANTPLWDTAYLGVIAAGCVAVPLDTAFKPEQVAKLLMDSGSSLLFTDVKHFEVAREAVALVLMQMKDRLSVRLVLLEKSDQGNTYPVLDEMIAAGPGDFRVAETSSDDIAVLLYTSGTTSDPKGVMLTQANLATEADAIFQILRVDETDTILGVLPLFHALAQIANLLLPLTVGCRVVYLDQLNTTELLRALRERNITLFCCVPQFFYLIHEKVMKQVDQGSTLKRFVFRLLMKLSRLGRSFGTNIGKLFFAKVHDALGTSMRYLITGGSRFDPQVGRDLETLGFDILQAYGLTETSGGATITPIGSRFIGSVGRGLPGVDVKITDSGLPLDNADQNKNIGEVLIRGPIIMKGYYNRPDATAEVLKDGWLYTGDLGYLDAAGNLFITGRKKEVIVLSSGKNIHPEEIEAHYLASPWIKEICVMGLQSAPGEPFSERLHAVVVPDMDVLREKKIVNMKEVIRFDIEGLSAQLPSTKRILSYDIWQTDLPRTSTRKLKRFEIQKTVQSQNGHSASNAPAEHKKLTASDSEWLSLPDVARALDLVRGASKKEGDVHPADNLELDLGLDSMERVELVVALEHALNAKAEDEALSKVYTIRELVDTVRNGIGVDGARSRAGWEEVFATESTDPEVLAVAEVRPIASRLWHFFGWFVHIFNKIFFGLEITGLEKLPKTGPFILSPNHQSFIDSPFLVAELPYPLHKDLFYVGTSEIFGSGHMRRLARSLKLIPVDPDANLVPAMRAGSYGLKHGKILVLYPEGERSIDGTPRIFKKGAAILSIHHNVPIYPVALDGFFDCWPRSKGFQGFHKVRFTIGDPIYPPSLAEVTANSSSEAAYEQLTAELKQRILDMWTPLHEKNLVEK